MKRKVLLGMILIFCFTLVISQVIFNSNNVQAASRKKSNPICVDGDDDFVKQSKRNGWPGSGTSADPYIIENYDIEIPFKKGKKSLPPAAISISNTTVHFVIRYSTLSNFNGEVDGIVLWNVINGQIYNNTIFNFANCIFLFGSDSIYIANNEMFGYSDAIPVAPSSQNIKYRIDGVQAFMSHGVFLDPSNHNIIVNNTISGYTGTGVYLEASSDNLIDGNEIDNSNGENGVFLAGSDYNSITDNDICGYGTSTPTNPSARNIRYRVDGTQAFMSHGVFLDPSNHNTISNNRISGYTGTGVYLLNSSDNLIDKNAIDNSVGENGVFLAGADYNSITNNEIFGYGTSTPTNPSARNIRYKVDGTQAFMSHGVFLDPSNHNIIANNTISGYTGTGVFLEASSDNLIDGNEIDNSNGENGVFLAGADYNSITNNDIYGYGTSTPTNPSARNIRYRVDGTQAFMSHGVFLDPSNHNTISNNRISGYTGTGVYLLNSSDNLIDKNAIDNSDGENGVFLAGSEYNSITNNDIYGYGTSTPINPSTRNIRYRVDGTQAFMSHGVFLDPSNHNIIANNTISGYTGTGVYLEASSDNLIDGNEIDNSNGENGVFLAGADYNSITNNDIYGYGTSTPTNPSTRNIRYRVDGTQAFMSHGVFLDPSNHNTISNNRISGYTGTGLYLLNSSDNLIDENAIDNSDGENGVFLAGADYNSITNNIIWGVYSESTATAPTSQNIRYKVDGTQAFMSHGVFLDPSNYNFIANNTISNNTGSGIYLLNSSTNNLVNNEISNNGENGILFENSDNTSVTSNVIYNDDLHGINLNFGSSDNIVYSNDFIGNNLGGTSQIYDDGSSNQFSSNFLVDHDNTDTNNDSYSDNPYQIDGYAGSTDPNPNALPVQDLEALDLNLADLNATVDSESKTLNLKNIGNWITVKVHLPVGYSVTNINVSTVYTDGLIYAMEAQVQNPRTLIVKFDRQALIVYLESVLPYTPIDIKLNVTGLLNGDFLMFYGYDIITIINEDPTDPVMLIDQVVEDVAIEPTQKVLDQIIKTSIEIPVQILMDHIIENAIINSPRLPSGLAIGILFTPMIATVVTRRFLHLK